MCTGSKPWLRIDMKARDGGVMEGPEHGDAGPRAAGVIWSCALWEAGPGIGIRG